MALAVPLFFLCPDPRRWGLSQHERKGLPELSKVVYTKIDLRRLKQSDGDDSLRHGRWSAILS